MKIGIIGAGRIGGNLAAQWARRGHDVLISFKRDRDELAADGRRHRRPVGLGRRRRRTRGRGRRLGSLADAGRGRQPTYTPATSR